MRIRNFFKRRRFLLAMAAALAVISACRGKAKEPLVYEGPVTDPKLKAACLGQADQLIGILREENFVMPDLRGKPPEKIELNHVFETYPYQTFTVQWPELELTLRTDGGLVELRRRTPPLPRPANTPRPVATTQTQVNNPNRMRTGKPGFVTLGEINALLASPPHVPPKQAITTETAHRQCLGLLKRLLPLTWQQFNKMRYRLPHEEQRQGEEYVLTGSFYFHGTVNGLPCDTNSVDFTINYTTRELESISIMNLPGIYPSVQDQRISAEEGARIAMEYLGEEYGEMTQMETMLHTLKLSFDDRPAGVSPAGNMHWDLHHPRLVHWYKICSNSLPPDHTINGFLDDVIVDAVSGIVLDHSHYAVIGASADVNYRNFVYKRFPDKE